MTKRISVDFDDTLTLYSVSNLVKTIQKEYPDTEIFITTARYCDALAHMYPKNPSNKCLYKKLKGLGISKRNVVFSNYKDKVPLLNDMNVLFHIDDREPETKPVTFEWIMVDDPLLKEKVVNYLRGK